MESKKFKNETYNYIGVDFGIVKLATFSVLNYKQDIMHQECISGSKLRFIRMRYSQKRKAKARSSGSQAASLITENRICKEQNFKIANKIVEIAEKYNALIVLEDLTNIRKNITNDHTLNNYEKKFLVLLSIKTVY